MKASISTINEMKSFSDYIIHEEEPFELKINTIFKNSKQESYLDAFIIEEKNIIFNTFIEFIKNNNVPFAVQNASIIQRHYLNDSDLIKSNEFNLSAENFIKLLYQGKDHLWNIYAEIFNKPFIIKAIKVLPGFSNKDYKNMSELTKADVTEIIVHIYFKYIEKSYINTKKIDYNTIELEHENESDDIDYLPNNIPDFTKFSEKRITEIINDAKNNI